MEMMVKKVPDTGSLKAATEQINKLYQNLNDIKVSLTSEERMGIRSVGSSRMGLVMLVSQLATQFNNKLSKEDNAENLSRRLEALHALRAYRLSINTLLEAIDDTDKALSRDIMKHADKFSDSLHSARKHDGDLDEGMREIDTYNSRFAHAMKEEDEVPKNQDEDTDVIPK